MFGMQCAPGFLPPKSRLYDVGVRVSQCNHINNLSFCSATFLDSCLSSRAAIRAGIERRGKRKMEKRFLQFLFRWKRSRNARNIGSGINLLSYLVGFSHNASRIKKQIYGWNSYIHPLFPIVFSSRSNFSSAIGVSFEKFFLARDYNVRLAVEGGKICFSASYLNLLLSF